MMKADLESYANLTKDEVECITQYLDVNTTVPERADFAFVPGTRHPEPAYLAADLFRRGVVERVVLAGGKNPLTGEVEANAHFEILLASRVPREYIIIESRSTNTLENVIFSLPLMAKWVDLECLKSVVVLTKWYHSRRTMMTLKRHLPDGIRYFAMKYEPPGVLRSNWWLSEEGQGRVLKEWHNIPKYVEKGDIAEIRKDGGAFV